MSLCPALVAGARNVETRGRDNRAHANPAFGGVVLPPSRRPRRWRGLLGTAGILPACLRQARRRRGSAIAAPCSPAARSIETCGRDARAPRKCAAPRSPAFVRVADVRAGCLRFRAPPQGDSMKRIEALRGLWPAHRQRTAGPAVLRDTLLWIVHPPSGPLVAIGEAFAGNRLQGHRCPKYGVL